jgi:TolA-binding protein
LDEAAATYLRIVAFFPTRKADASDALFAAAEIQKSLKREDEAKRLFADLDARYKETNAWKKAQSLGLIPAAPK